MSIPKIEWTKKNVLRAVYWGVFALMFVIAVVIFRQEGIWVEDYFGSEFYRLESSTAEEQVFRSKDCVVTQKGFFTENEVVFIEVQENGSEPLLWTLTRTGGSKLTASSEDVTYSGTYSINDYSCNFAFDDWDAYMEAWMEDYSGQVTSVSRRFASEGAIEGFLRMAYGQRDSYGLHSLPELLGWILLTVMAYVIGFHAETLFEWKKMWERDYRNADQLEPSDWYFISNYIGAGVIWLMNTLLYLCMIGLLQ